MAAISRDKTTARAAPQAHTVKTYEPKPQAPERTAKLIRESIRRAESDISSRAIRPYR
jgi:hypothetical protein